MYGTRKRRRLLIGDANANLIWGGFSDGVSQGNDLIDGTGGADVLGGESDTGDDRLIDGDGDDTEIDVDRTTSERSSA